MICPACKTHNRPDRETCYHCGQDLRLLRLIVNKARHHYNRATEQVEREHYHEALTELDEALALDNAFDEARVLRGVVMMRLHRPAEARREWEGALSNNGAHARAHKYLAGLGPVVRVLPVVRRARLVVAGAAAVVILAVAGAAWVMIPSANEATLQRAWGDFAARNLASSQQRLSKVARPVGDPALEKSARFLEASIREVEERFLDTAARAIAEGAYEDAAATLEGLEAFTPTPRGTDAIARARRQMVEALERRVGDMLRGDLDEVSFRAAEEQVARLEKLAGGTVDPARLRGELRTALRSAVERRVREMLRGGIDEAAIVAAGRQLNRFEQLALSPADAASLRDEMMLAARGALERQLGEIDQLIEAGGAAGTVRTRLAEAAALARITGREASVEARRSQLAQREAQRLYVAARAAADADDAGRFQEAVTALEALDPLPDEWRARAAALRAEAAERGRRALLAAFDRAAATGDFEAAVALARQARESGAFLSPELEERVRDARRRVALDAYYALVARAADFESGTVPSAQAEEALRLVGRAREGLPERLRPRATEDLAFFAAVSARSIGNTSRANDEIAALRLHNPSSPYIALYEGSAPAP